RIGVALGAIRPLSLQNTVATLAPMFRSFGTGRVYRVNRVGARVPVAYRYFEKEEWADAFCAGNPWLSTLQQCRKTDDSQRADPGEAKHLHFADDTSAWRTNEDLKALGIEITPEARPYVRLENLKFHQWLGDAVVLCSSLELSDALAARFGKYCVQVDDPEL